MVRENPALLLLCLRDRRVRPWLTPGRAALLALAVLPVAVAGPVLVSPPGLLDLSTPDTRRILATAALLTLAPLALGLALVGSGLARAGAVFASLREGGALPEVLATRTPPAELVDGLALGSFQGALRLLAACLPAALAACLFLPGEVRLQGILAVGAALAVMAALSLACAYLSAAWGAWPAGSLPGRWAVAGLGGGLGLAWISGLVGGGEAWPLLPLCLATAAAGRRVATAGLEAGREPAAAGARPAGPADRNPWIRPRTDNPLEVRQTLRLARRTPFGLLGVAARRAWLVGLGLGVAPLGPAWAWGAALAAAFLGAAWPALDAAAAEKENRTLEALRGTLLTPGEQVAGWLDPLTRDLVPQCGLLAAGLAALAPSWGPEALLAGLPAAAALVLAPGAGARLGLEAGLAADSRRAAFARLGGALGNALAVGYFALAFLRLAGPNLWTPALVAGLVAAALLAARVRSQAGLLERL